MIDVDTSVLPDDPQPKLVSLVWLYDDGSTINIGFSIVMVALCNRADHYIFMLWFVLSFFFFFPRLISAVGDWTFTILWHMVWP